MSGYLPVAFAAMQPFLVHELGAGGQLMAMSPRSDVAPAPGTAQLGGDIVWRHESHYGPFGDRSIGEGRLTLMIDDEGVTRLSRLQVSGLPFTLRIRPQLGDAFDLTLLGGSVDQVWAGADTHGGYWRTYTPVTLTALGLSNTDFDPDRKVKAYVQAGIGLGMEVSVSLLGPVGLYARAEGEARSLNRHQGDAENQVRHETLGEASAGVVLNLGDTSVRAVAWGELVTQWETRDADRASGVDRQLQAAGVRLVVRIRERPHQERPPSPRDGTVDGVADAGE